SGQSLGEEKFLDYVLEQFSVTGIDFNKICFEITETSVISNITCARQFISVLKEKGCRFALDDFGSGLSSFSYLKTLAVDYLKIDGNFVRSLLTDKNDYNLVISINQIGHVMGIDTVAEFVEDEATLAALSNIGVDYVQGYAVAYPQALEDKNIMNIPALITSGR
ncbi:MAG: EAL domain-containing protein, partial [Gammaproteobacteria bacterium]|nr:EAL domain-containing protein [Gammaproteobacteria bacterium]